jgi:hypothetical protein
MSNTLLLVQTLYESAVAFGMRKALQTEQGKNEMENRITTLESEVKDLERQVCRGAVADTARAARWAGSFFTCI